MRIRNILAGGALMLLAQIWVGVAQAQVAVSKESLSFTSPSRSGPVTVTAELFLPEAPAGTRLPAMLLIHGSGGVTDAREYAYARDFSAMGVASIVPDSFTPRGVKSTVSDQSTVSTNDMLNDAYNALKLAVQHPRLDPARIGIAGFSKGGSVALRSALHLMAERHARNGPRFALHVPFYPGCDTHYYNTRTTGAPILMLMGAADTYVGTENCMVIAQALKTAGAKLETTIYPGAQHGWDGSAPPWSLASGENWSKCFFVQQADLSWVEQSSGIKTAGPDGRPNADAPKALAQCRTLGVSGGANAAVRAEALAALKQAMRQAFSLP